MNSSVARGAQRLLDIFFPPRCAGCQVSGYVLCPDCIARVQPMPTPICRHCGLPLAANGLCGECQIRRLHLSGLRIMAIYEEPLRQCIHELKYGGNRRLAEPLGELLALGYHAHGLRVDMLAAVPLHSTRESERGYNHAHLLAGVCARRTGVPLRSEILIRRRATSAQVGLGIMERRQNVAGAFVCAPGLATGALRGRTILIIDDVCTTGATLEACAEPLFAAGAAAVHGLVLARAWRSAA